MNSYQILNFRFVKLTSESQNGSLFVEQRNYIVYKKTNVFTLHTVSDPTFFDNCLSAFLNCFPSHFLSPCLV